LFFRRAVAWRTFIGAAGFESRCMGRAFTSSAFFALNATIEPLPNVAGSLLNGGQTKTLFSSLPLGP
jgi:hypothetical protein